MSSRSALLREVSETMVRVEIRDSINAFIIRVQGRFAGGEAEQIGTLVVRFHTEMQLVVDLTHLTSIDSVGETTLLTFKSLGARFIAGHGYCLRACERLGLPLFRRESRKRQDEAAVPSLAATRT